MAVEGWLSMCKEFVGLTLEDFYLSWEGCMKGVGKDRKHKVEWVAPAQGSCKFNVDGTAMGKLEPTRVRGVLHDNRGRMLVAFFEPLRIIESNEAELRTIKSVLQVWSRFRFGNLINEGDSTNAISWLVIRYLPRGG